MSNWKTLAEEQHCTLPLVEQQCLNLCTQGTAVRPLPTLRLWQRAVLLVLNIQT